MKRTQAFSFQEAFSSCCCAVAWIQLCERTHFWVSAYLLINHITIWICLWGCLAEFIVISTGGSMVYELSHCQSCFCLCLLGNTEKWHTDRKLASLFTVFNVSVLEVRQTTATTARSLNHEIRHMAFQGMWERSIHGDRHRQLLLQCYSNPNGHNHEYSAHFLITASSKWWHRELLPNNRAE